MCFIHFFILCDSFIIQWVRSTVSDCKLPSIRLCFGKWNTNENWILKIQVSASKQMTSIMSKEASTLSQTFFYKSRENNKIAPSASQELCC